jgi:hypothetical protein
MPEIDDAALERRLRGVLKEHLGALPLDLTADALERRREAKGVARWSGRGRGITLLAAAALLLVGGALAAGSGILRLPTVIPPVPEPSVIAVATASPDATSPSPSESAAPSASLIPVAGPGGVWVPIGSMVTPRRGHAAVRLLDGRVLVIGGASAADEVVTSADLYDPVTGTWTATGQMVGGGETFTMLRDGRVLAVGGDGAEVYDPGSGTWTATAEMIKGVDLSGNTATLLGDGRVLVAGRNGAHLYDPDSGSWTATGKMNIPRISRHIATLLPDGKVLVAGGWVEGELIRGDPPSTDAAEVYDPVTGSWTKIADMEAPHEFLTGMVTPLRDGKVLFVSRSGAEIFDPVSGTWTARATPTEYGIPRAVLSDEAVLFAPVGNSPDGCTAAALFDPRTGSLTAASSMLKCGFESSFTLLLDGTVLKAGGRDCFDTDCGSAHTSAELYVPAGVSLPPLPAFPSPPPPDLPSPTPRPTPLSPAAGPVPPNARSWTVTVDNESSEPATLFVAEDDGTLRLVGSATPNVVPAGATVQVTFRFPVDGGWIFVNPRPGDREGLVNEDQIGVPGKILIREDGEGGWLSPG